MTDRLYKIRKEDPNFDKKLVDIFAKSMPKLLTMLIEGNEYDKHIGSFIHVTSGFGPMLSMVTCNTL